MGRRKSEGVCVCVWRECDGQQEADHVCVCVCVEMV